MVSRQEEQVSQAIKERIDTARKILPQLEQYNQEQIDEIVTAIAWAGCKEGNPEYLAKLATEETDYGNVEDKIRKIRNKIKGTLRDLKGEKSVGIVDVNEKTGITRIAKPKGVIGALIPVTNPEATPIHNAMIALKGANAIIFAPHPRGKKTCAEVVRLIHKELAKVGAPLEAVQYIPEPTIELSQELMRNVDFVIATGGGAMVKAAYSSGTPAIGVGPGNPPVVIDSSADIDDAVEKISIGTMFDYNSSCSNESCLIIEESIYDEVREKLRSKGGYLLSGEEKEKLANVLWVNGVLNREVIIRSPQVIASKANLSQEAAQAKFFLVEEEGIGKDYPFSREKLSVILTLYKYSTFEEAIDKVNQICSFSAPGHSCGIHSHNEDHILRLALAVPVCRVLVNQVHVFGNGGFFNNGLWFTLSLGCGSWGGTSTDDNLTYYHLINYTKLVRTIPEVIPTDEELWGNYLRKYG
ncbi:MAG: aldehyde dehydrogenase family protein [Dehalococcoidales bacterium]